MSYNFIEDLKITGHLQIAKCFPDGLEEIVFDDHNIIVSGMGLGLAQMFSLAGPPSVRAYQIERFQVGVSGSANLETPSTNSLAGPLSSVAEYGLQAKVLAITGHHATTINTYKTDQWFGFIETHKVSRVGPNSVRFTITLDQDAANETSRDSVTVPLNEIGLFMKNPLGDRFGLGSTTSVLVAYRYFSPIAKTSDFSLVFRWTLNF
jgi:hypothetical protein